MRSVRSPVRFHAVVFDLFETLVTEFDPDWRWHPAGTPAGRLGVPREVFDQVWRSRAVERMTRPTDYRAVLREACDLAGIGLDASVENVIAELHSERLAAKAMPLLDVGEAVLEALHQLRSYGLKLGLVSNCSVEEVAAWEQSPLAPLFDAAVFSYRVGHAKPVGDSYLMACRRLGTPPEHCVFVGDGGSEELLGAARVGMKPYCARWFLDRWPEWRRRRTDDATAGYPPLRSLTELVTLVS